MVKAHLYIMIVFIFFLLSLIKVGEKQFAADCLMLVTKVKENTQSQ